MSYKEMWHGSAVVKTVSQAVTVKEAIAAKTVAFDMNGHGTQVPAQTVNNGELAVRPEDPVENGWAFCGWYVNSELKETFYFNTTPITEDTTVYAMWKVPVTEAAATITPPVGGQYPDVTPESGDITRYTAGGVASLTEVRWKTGGADHDKNTVFTAGTEYTPYIAFRAGSGYCFTEETVFKINGMIAERFSTTGNSLFIVGAKHIFTASAPEAVTYKVSFNSNGGTGIMEDAAGLTGIYTLPANTFTAPAGKRFQGWSLTKGGEIINALEMTEDRTVYAIWEDIPAVHTHSWKTDWTYGADAHWHECEAADCPITADKEKNGYAAHEYDNESDTSCNVCGYIRTVPSGEGGSGSGSSGSGSNSSGSGSGSGNSGNSGGSSGSGSSSGSSGGSSGSGKSSGSGGSSGSSGVSVYTGGNWNYDTAKDFWTYTLSGGSLVKNSWKYLSYGNQTKWYHFDADGRMNTGWLLDTDGLWYYLNEASDGYRGAMMTGWQFIDGKWYDFAASGEMYANTVTPDGYSVDASGAWIQ